MKLRTLFIRSTLGLALAGLAALTAAASPRPQRAQASTPAPTQPPIIVVVPGSGGGGAVATPDARMPLLVVDSYAVDPNPVRSNQNFNLTFTVKNVGTRQADQITVGVESGNFVGLGTSAPVTVLDPGFSANFALQVRAAYLASGAYDLPLRFTFRVGDSGEFATLRQLGVQVTGGTGVTGRPLMVVESVTPLTLPAAPGDAFGARVIFRNTGPRKAYSLNSTFKLNDYLSPAQGSGTAQLGDVAPAQAVTLTLNLVLNKVSTSGRVAQTFSLDYRDVDNKSYTSDETASLDLGVTARQSPQLIVAGYTTDPARPAPGVPFSFTLQVSNVGTGEARQVLLRLGDEGSLEPFAPLGASNVHFVAGIGAGATAEISQTLIADGAAKGGAYRLKVGMTYADALGEAKTESETISLLVLVPPQLRLDLSEPLAEPLVVSQTFDVPVEVVNIGRQTVNISTVEVTSPDLALTEASLYLGPLDAGTSGSLTAKATPRTAGTAAATLVVHYLDDFNQEQTFTQPLTFTIEAPPPVVTKPETKATPSGLEKLWQGILGVLGLGG